MTFHLKMYLLDFGIFQHHVISFYQKLSRFTRETLINYIKQITGAKDSKSDIDITLANLKRIIPLFVTFIEESNVAMIDYIHHILSTSDGIYGASGPVFNYRTLYNDEIKGAIVSPMATALQVFVDKNINWYNGKSINSIKM